MDLPPGLGTKKTSFVPIGIFNPRRNISLVPATCPGREEGSLGLFREDTMLWDYLSLSSLPNLLKQLREVLLTIISTEGKEVLVIMTKAGANAEDSI